MSLKSMLSFFVIAVVGIAISPPEAVASECDEHGGGSCRRLPVATHRGSITDRFTAHIAALSLIRALTLATVNDAGSARSSVGLIGSKEDVLRAMHAFGWLPADPINIGPDIDAERDLLMRDLREAGMVQTLFQTSGTSPTLLGRNGEGDPY